MPTLSIKGKTLNYSCLVPGSLWEVTEKVQKQSKTVRVKLSPANDGTVLIPLGSCFGVKIKMSADKSSLEIVK